jgi:hypothetical protein
MQTPAFDIFLGILLWALAMVIPLLLIFVPNAEFKTALLTLVYPNLLVFLSRNGRFWISKGVVAGASVVAFVLSILFIIHLFLFKEFIYNFNLSFLNMNE